ncbi:MAG: hypothetical protein RLZZ135_873, partial [Cyanobacteriota bacterium]
MDSNQIVNVDRQSEVNLTDVNLTTLRADSLAQIDRLQASLNDELSMDIGEIQERLNRSFRQFL